MRVSRRAAGLTVAFVAIAALGGFTLLQMRAANAESDDDSIGSDSATASVEGESASRGSDIAIPVEVGDVVRDTLVVSVTATGQAAPVRQVVLAAQVAGRVAHLPLDESDGVGAGGLVVGLDAEDHRLALEQARARRASSEAAFREQTLFDDRITDAALRAERERVARAKSGLDEAEIAVRKAEMELARTAVAAPFAGRIANLRVVPGQYVTAGTELATVVDLDPIKVEVQVLEGEVGYLQAGRSATVTLAAFPGERFTGRVQTINPVVDQTTRTARVTVLVPNPGRRILPGMYARVSLEAQRFPDRVIVPRDAVIERDRFPVVFVFDGSGSMGEARWRYVATGLGNATQVEVMEHPEKGGGVQPGERVLTDGHFTLTDGARVRMVESVQRDEGRRP